MASNPTLNGPVPVGNPAGFFKYLHNDILSGFLVFLIALPLCLGIAAASNFPLIAGVFTAVVGSIVATLISNSELTIKGPAAGMIVICMGAINEMKTVVGEERAYAAVLAIGVTSGVIQIAFGLLKSGIIGEFFPTSVVHGMLAAIGIIIISKQSHVLLGVKPEGTDPLGLLAEIPNSLQHMNPYIAIIGFVSLFILFGSTFIKNKAFKKIPIQMIVMIVAILMGLAFEFNVDREYSFLGHTFEMSSKTSLVNVPSDLLHAITGPDFSVLRTFAAWKWIIMYALIGSLESILSAKAIDMLDPYSRKSNLNRDLLAVGIGNTIASMIGGLPMISEIVRSKANIDNGAKTRFANFWHGMFLLVSISFLGNFIHLIPMAALAAMLVFTGFRLASPNEFVKVFKTGREQLFIFVFTMVMVLATELLTGIILGIVVKLVIHTYNGVPLSSLFLPFLDVETRPDGVCVIHAKKSAVFTNWVPFRRQIVDLGLLQRSNVIVDLSGTNYVDHTVMEKLHELQEEFKHEGLNLDVVGLEGHEPMSGSSLSARKIGIPTMHRLTIIYPKSLEGDIGKALDLHTKDLHTVLQWKSSESQLGQAGVEESWRVELVLSLDESRVLTERIRGQLMSAPRVTLLIETVGVLQGLNQSWVSQSPSIGNELKALKDDSIR